VGSAATPGMLTGSSLPQQPKRAIIHVRVSRYRDQGEKISPERRIGTGDTPAECAGAVVAGVLHHVGLSGGYPVKRLVARTIPGSGGAERTSSWCDVGHDPGGTRP
jgi:hypothetical protein